VNSWGNLLITTGGVLQPSKFFYSIISFEWKDGAWRYTNNMLNGDFGIKVPFLGGKEAPELVYNFPIAAPFLVMFFNAYSAVKHTGFEGSECYLIGCCGISSFACMEPITRASATMFVSAIMKILLRYGFCHTVVLDKDSKFFGVCREAIDLLKINLHVLSSAKSQPYDCRTDH
jgi:hypothetical protein